MMLAKLVKLYISSNLMALLKVMVTVVCSLKQLVTRRRKSTIIFNLRHKGNENFPKFGAEFVSPFEFLYNVKLSG